MSRETGKSPLEAASTGEWQLPAPVARRGISEAAWRTLMNNLYPGAKAESVIMVWDYCLARKLDPLKKPCHIVVMPVNGEWRDVVMPGIYEYRTTATRTGLYMGHSKPEYGPEVEHLGIRAPQWCAITIYRWNKEAGQKCEYPAQVYFRECAATKRDKQTGEISINERWTKAPIQMMTKCTEAAALREAFPDELGGEHTAEEMAGQAEIDVTPSHRPDPRVDHAKVNGYISRIADLLAQDKEGETISVEVGNVFAELNATPVLYMAVCDQLVEKGILTKAQQRACAEAAAKAGKA